MNIANQYLENPNRKRNYGVKYSFLLYGCMVVTELFRYTCVFVYAFCGLSHSFSNCEYKNFYD